MLISAVSCCCKCDNLYLRFRNIKSRDQAYVKWKGLEYVQHNAIKAHWIKICRCH